MSILAPAARKATAAVRGLVRTDVTETDPQVVTLATYTAAVEELGATATATSELATAAASDAEAALSAAQAAVAAADSFPVEDFKGTISGLSQDPGAAASNSGKWWVTSIAGTLSHGNAGGITVADGDRILSNGTSWLVYATPPTYVPSSSLAKEKLAAAVRTTLTIADATASEWMDQTTVSEGVSSPTASDAEGTENTTRICGEAISATGTITSVTWYAAVTGDHEIRIYSKSGSVFTLEDSLLVTVASTGVQTLEDIAIDVQAGWYVGFFSATGRITQDNGVAGKSLWIYAGDASTSATFTQYSSIRLQIGWTLLSATPQLPAAIEVPRAQLDTETTDSLDAADFLVGEIVGTDDVLQGVQSPAYETVTTLDSTRLYGEAASTTGTISQVVLYANGAGTMEIRVYSRDGSTFTLQQSHPVTCTEGVNTFSGLSIPVTQGEFIGVYAGTAGLGQVNDGTGDGIWTSSGDADPSGTFTNFPTVSPQIGWTLSGRTLQLPDTFAAPEIEVIQTATQVRVFVPSVSGACVEYVLGYFDAGAHQSVWRISACYIVTRNAAHDYTRDRFGGVSVTDDGAWEFAVKVSGEADWVGTWHAYETLSTAFHFRDGARIESGSANHTCREWELVQRSAVYRYGTTTLLAYRTMRLSFTASGIRCRQSVEWQAAVTLEHAYLAMLPIERVIGATQITDTAITAPICAEQDVSASGFTEIASTTGDFIRIWGSDSGVSARFEVVQWPTEDHLIKVANSPYYNKLYADNPSAAVTASTVWTTEWTAAVETSLA